MPITSNEITFTTLRELRDWLNDIDDEALDAQTSEADFFTAYVDSLQHNRYFHIKPCYGGEE